MPHPILLLPDELLSEIFTQYLPPYPQCPPLVGPSSPTYLLGISRAWRAIALHTPTLWRAIKLEVYTDQGSEIALQWLERSGSSLLSLQLSTVIFDPLSDMPIPPADTEWEKPLVQALVANRWRWQYVNWDLGPSMVSRTATSPLEAPQLVELTLGTVRQSDEFRGILFLHNCTRLRSVSLWNVGYASESLPWAQLTTLALLNTEPPTHCVSILLLARSLVRLRVYTRRSTSDASTQNNALPDRIELPLLETLVLDNNDEPPHNWLSPLVLPSLRHLAISCELLGSRWKHSEFAHLDAFMARCRPPLEHLQVTWGLGYFDLPGPGLAHVLQASFSAATIRLCPALSLDDKSWTTDRYWNEAAAE
ncbi:hypothetical protein HMN09_00793000 [Mycena chlorophos]|uniref:F-box domain-containing protein n=1 Tax=Mycena chlorophos TaxID=658473 RepID=A0A8H6STX5_MYCCL|nr:hypothetical protein HMN09_00793000 [Mycena chlorophos]